MVLVVPLVLIVPLLVLVIVLVLYQLVLLLTVVLFGLKPPKTCAKTNPTSSSAATTNYDLL